MKIQAELDTQIAMVQGIGRASTPSVTFQATSGRRPPFARNAPTPRRSETAYRMDGDTEQGWEGDEWGLPFGGGDGEDAVRALSTRPAPSPAGRPPVGSLGPPVPSTSRFTQPRGPGGPRRPVGSRPPPDESKVGRFTMGHANYGGCHNCGDKDHMARDCTKPMQQRLLALVSQTEDWALDDAEAFLEQGLPECLDDYWTDPQVIMDYCQQISNGAEDAGGPSDK
jgi:hypothetical protein